MGVRDPCVGEREETTASCRSAVLQSVIQWYFIRFQMTFNQRVPVGFPQAPLSSPQGMKLTINRCHCSQHSNRFLTDNWQLEIITITFYCENVAASPSFDLQDDDIWRPLDHKGLLKAFHPPRNSQKTSNTTSAHEQIQFLLCLQILWCFVCSGLCLQSVSDQQPSSQRNKE